jgi:hypothetical protein
MFDEPRMLLKQFHRAGMMVIDFSERENIF